MEDTPIPYKLPASGRYANLEFTPLDRYIDPDETIDTKEYCLDMETIEILMADKVATGG
ncbi:MAG: hypothetical protein GYA17_14555 [Chloroflexi bacterium]|jgi:hypothetical protein|nr:hypothetical protein [Anaerolineaceae bacterium]NMB89577.1 hypothetical protein [Chloroflexota bacterium]